MEQANSFGAAFGRLMKRKRGTHVTLAELARRIYPNLGEDAEKRKGDLSKLENGKVPNPNAATVAKIAKALGITDEEIETLQRRALAPLSDQLQEIAVLSRDELELLASRFEAEKPHTRSDAELKDFLTKKAEDYRRIRAEVDGLKGLSTRIDNVRAAAEQAITDLQFDEARSLLDQAREIQKDLLREPLKANAALLERVADIDLLQGRVDEAFRQLRAAADSFAAIDQREPIRLKVHHYCTKLYTHGFRYGSAGLARAADLVRPCLSDDLRNADPHLWMSAQVWLANALQTQGTRMGGEAGTTLLAQAVLARREALEVFTPIENPILWKKTTEDLSATLATLGGLTEGEASSEYFSQSVLLARKVLETCDRVENPFEWARAAINLADRLSVQGTFQNDESGTSQLSTACDIYTDVLTVFTSDVYPDDFASILWRLATFQKNLTLHAASALVKEQLEQWEQTGNLGPKPESRALIALESANRAGNFIYSAQHDLPIPEGGRKLFQYQRPVSEFRDAMKSLPKLEDPIRWAHRGTMFGHLLIEHGKEYDSPNGTGLFSEAISVYQDVLTVFSPADHPVQWAMTQKNMAVCELSWAQHPACDDPLPHLRAALAHVDAALTVYDPVHMAYDHGTATALRSDILAALGP